MKIGESWMDCKTAQKMIDLYIKKQLNTKEMEAFLAHIKDCGECREELEIYFTVYMALQKLDEERDVSFNIQKLLQDNLAASKRKVHRLKVIRLFNFALVLWAEIILAMVILTQIQAWHAGGYNDTYMYRIVYEREAEPASEEAERESEKMERESVETENRNGKENSTDRRA